MFSLLQLQAAPIHIAHEAVLAAATVRRSSSARGDGSRTGAATIPADFKDKVAAINVTYDDVSESVDSVNTTIMGVVDLIKKDSGSMESAIGTMQKVVDNLKPVVGEELTDWIDALVGKLLPKLEEISSQAEAVRMHSQVPLNGILADFLDLREKVVVTYTDAAARIDELADICSGAAAEESNDDSASTAAFLLHSGNRSHDSQERGPIDWLKGIFGGGGKSNCGKATQRIAAANSTADDAAAYIVKLNNTVDVLLDEVEGQVTEGFDLVNSTYSEAVQQASSILNEQVKRKLDEAVAKILDLVSSVNTQLQDAAAGLHKQLQGATADMQPLYAATEELVTMAEPCCAALEGGA